MTDQGSPARVFVRMAYKINLGNFETLDLDYAIEDDVKAGELVGEAHERVKAAVASLLHEDVTEQKAGIKGNGARRH